MWYSPPHLFLDELLAFLWHHVDQVELGRHRPPKRIDVSHIGLGHRRGGEKESRGEMRGEEKPEKETPNPVMLCCIMSCGVM